MRGRTLYPALRAPVLGVLAGLLAMLAMTSVAQAGGQQQSMPLSSCFWMGPYSTVVPSANGEDGSRLLFPEENATYWLARYDALPAGSTLTLTRNYAYARHESLNAYQTIQTQTGSRRGFPSSALADYEINPDAGSTNPYVPGNRRDDPHRSYTVTIAAQNPPANAADRQPNTLYAGTASIGPSEVMLRVYVPDSGRNLLGGTKLPEAHLRLADGTVLEGDALCAAINNPDRTIPPPLLTQPQWQSFLGSAYNQANCPATAPATPTLAWNRFFNTTNTLTLLQHCGTDPDPLTSPVVQGGFYSTLHNSYISLYANRAIGPVVVLHGKAPTFRDTSNPRGRISTKPTQTRYWSICTAEGFSTTATPHGGCVKDEDVPLDKHGYYTVVMSTAADRPANARRGCGVAWINWGDNGDGTRDASGNLLNPNYGAVILRQMLADSSFTQAIKNIPNNASVASTMGDYYPTPTYSTKAQFEAGGCRCR